MEYRIWRLFDAIIRVVVGTMLLISAACFALGQNPVPLINQPLVPDAVAVGGAAFNLMVNGSGFVPGAVVNWNGSARATTFVSNSRLSATILSSDIAKPHAASVTVVNPAPGGGRSNVASVSVSYPGGPFDFDGLANFGNGNTSVFAATGDLNNDGVVDLAVADLGNSDVMVMLGNGDGTFQPAVHYALTGPPAAIAVGDFNGDGNLDLAVSDNNLSILLGNGDGTFQPAVAVSAGGMGSLAAADFNRDGKLDLAGADINGAVIVLLGNGNGTFKAPVSYPLTTGAESVAVGDFNGDGKPDLAVALGNSDGSGAVAAVLLGKGDGTFQPAVNYVTGQGPYGITIADFNGDGRTDIATANAYAGTVSILLGNGDGTFQSHVDYGIGSSPGSFPVSIASADFSSRGKLDLIVANLYGNDVSVLQGNGDGTFPSARTYVLGTGNDDSPYSVAVADFNNDGRPDVVVPTYSTGQAGILMQIPTVGLSKSALGFANQLVGASSSSQTVTLTNTSAPTLQIGSTAVSGANATDFTQTHTCGSPLTYGASCTITVVFKPTLAGIRTAIVTITDNAVASPQQVSLTGTGLVSGTNASLSATSVNFGTQLLGITSAAQVVTLSDYGTSPLNISGIAIGGDFHETTTCGSTLAAGASCTISVTFKPTQLSSRSGTLSITDNAPGSPHTVALSGTGTDEKLTPASLAFGTVTLNQSKSLATILTASTTALSITGITITGTNAGEFHQVNTCGSGLAAGTSCTITVTFRPTKFGSATASISITDSGNGSPQQVPLQGYGWAMIK